MRVVALVSGGKDSCYNMVQCVAAGHDIVALANLSPSTKDELDSYMYQTVGHMGVALYAEAMGLPLFRQPTEGRAILQDKDYCPTPEDEVEDLYDLLTRVKNEVNIEAVAVGAILSDYQRIRVENVCVRLGLVSLAYLWRRDQGELLQEMIDCNINAIIIKVAAMGLEPTKHLGMKIADLKPHLVKMKEKYGLNVCGEGGEYETFTLDCPLFVKSIVIDEFEMVLPSDNSVAAVGYLNFKQFHLECKDPRLAKWTQQERIAPFPVKTWSDLLQDLQDPDRSGGAGEEEDEELENLSSDAAEVAAMLLQSEAGNPSQDVVNNKASGDTDTSTTPGHSSAVTPTLEHSLLTDLTEVIVATDKAAARCNDAGWYWLGSIVGQGDETQGEATEQALCKLKDLLSGESLTLHNVVAVSLYIRDMENYSVINQQYKKVFNFINPPIRVCVQAPLAHQCPLVMEAIAFRPKTVDGCLDSSSEEMRVNKVHTMHVQGVSHWAPANIGPYSQAVRVGDLVYVAGQIALVPGTMEMVEGGVRKQCRLALRHVGRIVRAMDPNTQLRDVVQGVCYVTHPSYIPEARREWEKRTNNAIVDYVVVPKLPRGALLEWQVWAHIGNSRFEYEETGCCIGVHRVSLRKRWNYENTVSVVVCYVSTGSSNSGQNVLASANASETEEPESGHALSIPVISAPELGEVFRYTLSKLHKGVDPSTTCAVRVLHVSGSKAPPPTEVRKALEEFPNVVTTLVPVCRLTDSRTVLSICAVRHQ
ncbi:hypothetical protein FOCC_FOCC016358 [Frankliniella occidentalis]|uniref:Diphthine--ammonia ligase n=1 Tax=Frankliniella occidentalis TaxID=133901 RepID=A0A6J1TT85_FRAOC|nr:uncharacterized protein LOC113217960 [Frankliniella occidentalis]XP_026293856.1 uncharacterized protein LOC113217960 [Frankliniella occidentalis]KAE8738160.1 hypothetical protein FOCC_FOCC016358 [Frankliniella occidentalis]